jgi:dUTP pyrophosphatase
MTETDNNEHSASWKRPFYMLYMSVSSDSEELKKRYRESAAAHNSAVQSCLLGDTHCDAGFDLFNPTKHEICRGCSAKLNHEVVCCMKFFTPGVPEFSVGYNLYPRSSTGTKTPLRLSNSVGIIDSGYRGNIIAAFDNWRPNDTPSFGSHTVEEYDRVVQICPPNLTHPMAVTLVESIEMLGSTTRGAGGFGSSGR